MKWILYLLLTVDQPDKDTLPLFCAEVLEAFLGSEETDDWHEELLSTAQTADLIYVLLCQTDRHTGLYYYFPGMRGCRIIELLWKNSNSPSGDSECASARAKLNAVSGRTRGRIVSSLVLRARHIAEVAVGQRPGRGQLAFHRSFFLAMRSLHTLLTLSLDLSKDPVLLKVFRKYNIALEYASAFSVLTSGAHAYKGPQNVEGGSSRGMISAAELEPLETTWRLTAVTMSTTFVRILAQSTPYPQFSACVALAGGLLHTTLRCLIHLPPEAPERSTLINITLPFISGLLPAKRAMSAVSIRYPQLFPSKSGENELDTLLDQAQHRSNLRTLRRLVRRCEPP